MPVRTTSWAIHADLTCGQIAVLVQTEHDEMTPVVAGLADWLGFAIKNKRFAFNEQFALKRMFCLKNEHFAIKLNGFAIKRDILQNKK